MIDHDLLKYLEGFITDERKQRFIQVLEQRTKYLTLAVEDVFQLHNTSALVRSCEAFGIQEAHIIEDRFGKRLDKNIAMGAQQWVDVHRYKNAKDCIHSLRNQGYHIIATSPHRNSCFLNEFNLAHKSALFFGTEKDGLSTTVIDLADGFLKIPMAGFTESLNVSVSAAIILQHLTTQLRESDLDWRLTDVEKLEKQYDWTQKSVKSVDDILRRYHERQ